jgi:xylulokinase
MPAAAQRHHLGNQRAVDEAQRIIDSVGWARLSDLGHRASPSYSGPKILWVREHQPEIFAQTHKFLHAKDFIVARLTGNFVSDYSDASGTNLYDLEAWDWSGEILQATDLDRDRLPELHASTDVVGEVLAEVAGETGLAAGTPVVIGGGDGCCAATSGCRAGGSAYNYVGSSSWIAIASRSRFDPAMRTFTFAHLVPGMWPVRGTMQAAGAPYQWLPMFSACLKGRQPGSDQPIRLMNLQAQTSRRARGLLFLPYLLGAQPALEPKSGAYLGLTMQHKRADIIRATLEGISLNLRVILEAFQEQGAGVEAMRVIGGGARGRIWRQIMADIYNLPVLRPALLEEATSLGAALAGGIGVGLYPGFSLAEQLTPIVDTVLPDPAVRQLYDRLYSVFNRSYEAFAPLYDELAEL